MNPSSFLVSLIIYYKRISSGRKSASLVCILLQKIFKIGPIMEGSWSRFGYIQRSISMWRSLFHRKPFEFLIQPKFCMENSCVRKWTTLTDTVQGKSPFLLMALMTIQRVGKAFVGICAVFYFVLKALWHYL